MSVFDLEEVAEKGVAGHRLHEAGFCREVPLARLSMRLYVARLTLEALECQFLASTLVRLFWLRGVLESLLEVMLQTGELRERLL